MQFDPKLVHPDEPPLDAAGDLVLPPELATLGEQLRDDAAQLAACYPGAVERCVAAAGPSSALSYEWRRSLVAGGAAVAAMLVAVTVWQVLPDRPTPQPTAAATSDVASPLPDEAGIAPAAGSRVSLVDLSGPELEALVDLLARDPERVTSISF